MAVLRFLVQLFRQAPSKRQLLASLALGGKGGDRTVTSADGTTLSVRAAGDGPPLVLVHGMLDDIAAFSFVELALAERYTVWVYDRRGRGDSGDGEDYSLDREVEDLRAVAAATGAVPHVVAHSYGALVAIHAAAAGVEMRSLVLYEPPVNALAASEGTRERVSRAVDEGRLDDAIEAMAIDLAGVTDEELSVAMGVPPVRKAMRDAVLAVPRELDAARAADRSVASTPPLELPVLFLSGERDSSPAYPRPDQMADIAADAETVTFEGQGHLAHTFTPAAFADTVLAFLDRH